MNRREAERLIHQQDTLRALGFTRNEADSLRRISMTLRRWHELECGTGEGQVMRSVERENDDGTGRPFLRVQYPTRDGYVDRRYPVADRETGARKRLAKILERRNSEPVTNGKCTDPVATYIQTDPRGAALYLLRPGDVPEGEDVSAHYSRGVCVY